MELSPSDSIKISLAVKRLKDFYLNGSSVIKESNGIGLINVSIGIIYCFEFTGHLFLISTRMISDVY